MVILKAVSHRGIDMNYKIYADDMDKATEVQFLSAMGQPFVKRGALMPDAHLGYSLPIGGVVLTDNFVVPSWVGFDIGCGVCALEIKCSIGELKDHAGDIYNTILQNVPIGFKHHKKRTARDSYYNNAFTERGHQVFASKGGTKQLGTLGGGNHFIEIGHDDSRKTYIVIHSGSRGIGHGIASLYVRMADPDGKCRDGHHGFVADSALGRDYMLDQNVCLEFALENRKKMLQAVVHSIESSLYREVHCNWATFINKNHNHAVETPEGILHRKGATDATLDSPGIIPGNMRDGTYIVRGLGNPESLWSSSHGAGRVLGRKAAKRELDMAEFTETMQGIKAKVHKSTLDESPMAYKDFRNVMYLQQDLVEIQCHIKPLINVKG